MENLEFQNIIHRYFRGQLADSEYEMLTVYLQDAKNRKYFEEAKLEWEIHPELDDLAAKNLTRLRYKINQEISAKPKLQLTRQLWVRVASVAAILVIGLLLGSAVTYLISPTKRTAEQLVFQTPRGEKSMVTLPDGSEVWLNANSRLVYNSFSSDHRQVELKGEAFFKVAHNEKAPFVVRTNECDITVLGTTFNVMAYDEFGRKEITLLTGKVNVHTESTEQILKPGQALILEDHQIHIVEVTASEASAWVDNKFNFRNIPLTELLKRLENWYDVDITLENQTGRDVNFTGTFKNEETIWQVLDAIKVYTPIKYQKSDLRQIKITVE
ncbi:MAG: FecR domain-containing protein [Prolixibacteraceae bacterium]|nr:FecR domain-containing protein [Prolixibacteraceae bacterium]